MDPVVSSLWRAMEEAIVLLFRAAPGYEARLTPTAMMMLSGELVADFNYIAIYGGPNPVAQLRECSQPRVRAYHPGPTGGRVLHGLP